ncbi:MAG: hypothetical protein RL213_1616 [Bacteroidota bacterium]
MNIQKNTIRPTVLAAVFSAVIAMVMLCKPAYSQCTGPNTVQDPQQFTWTYHPVTANNPVAYYSGVLEVGQATFVMNNGQTLTTRAYRQQGGNYSIPGPTIKVVPGNKYVLQLHNTLPYAALNTSLNVYKDPNATNIHTHGLHISGETPGDNTMRAFEGGRGGDFVWDIPANHMGGTFWYHAHHHGSSFLQISGGLFGMLIVDDANDGMPANVAAMSEKQLVLGYLDKAAAGTGGDVLLSGSLTPTWTVNGIVNGNICMPPNTWQHWRILAANRSDGSVTLTWGTGCQVMLLARDGVWRTVTPKAMTTNSIVITGASRVDVAIRITGNSTFSVDGGIAAAIIASGTPNPGPHPFAADGVSTWSAIRPNYLRDLRGLGPVHLETVSMGARTINGSKFNPSTPNFTLQANQIQEWDLSGNSNHPFHLHTFHLQAQISSGSFEAGEYYDVLTASGKARFDLNAATSTPYSGMGMMHCHLLDHEDQGAMGWMNVIGGQGPPTFPADGDLTTPFSDYYVIAGATTLTAPTNLAATAPSSTSIQLAWTDNSSNETGFNIERSPDGMHFSPLASVGANVVTYSDNTLSASTTYYYRVNAFNAGGNSTFSNVASATTQSGGTGGTVLYVNSITVTRASAGAGKYKGVATVRIVNGLGAAVPGATVTGLFTGPTSSTVSGTTDANGQVVLNSISIKNPAVQWCYEVTNVTIAGYTYSSSSNLVTKACENGPVFTPLNGGNSESQPVFYNVAVSPNPFGSVLTITYNVRNHSLVELEVYSPEGKRMDVSTSRSSSCARVAPPTNGISCNDEDEKESIRINSESLDDGIYILMLRSGTQVNKLRIVHVK